tara:strand:- start:1637 stop:2353 length:717 start_codon:yes stop_codon:yes gene_type:complete
MNNKTSAIVLKTTKYNDNSLIVKLFTKKNGLRSYIVGISKKGNRIATFQGLNQIVVETSQHGNNKLARIKNAQIETPYKSIHTDWVKGSVIQFLNELLYNSIQEESANIDLYEFIENHLSYFDESDNALPNFHIYFMIKMSKYLGFYPQGEWKSGVSFNLVEGNYQSSSKLTTEIIESQLAKFLYDLSTSKIEHISLVKMNSKSRRDLLKSLILYFRIHLDGFKEMKSQEILETVFAD